jgi:23S rRNA (guanosine2251-2'-O)-methyltransferase
MIIYGINPVLEALRAGRVRRLRVAPRADKRMQDVLALAEERGVSVDRADAQTLDRLTHGGVHQGIAAEIADARTYSVADLLAAADPMSKPLLVVLDGVEDPHNVGAILRTADAAGATGVIRQSRHSATLDGVVAKASAGALATTRIATVVNIARAIDDLKNAGLERRPRGQRRGGVHGRRLDAPDRARARRRRQRSAAAGGGALRSARPNPDGGCCIEPQRVRRGGRGII